MNTVTGTSTIEAPAAMSRCQETSRPIGALIAAIPAERAIIAGRRLVTQRRGRGRRDQHPEHEQGADDAEADDDGERDHDQHHELEPLDRQAERRGPLTVEREQQEGPVEQRDEREHGRP